MTIRTANISDKENIVKLIKNGLKEFGFSYLPETSEADLVNFDREYGQNDGTFLIMESEQKELIATGAIKKISDHVYKIRKMYVSKFHRKKGYGKAILRELLKIAEVKEAQTVLLETSDRMVAAKSLYKKFGFIDSAIIPVSPRCDITMIKKMDYVKPT